VSNINDMLKTIVPKSSQLNADDLIGDHSLTIKITKVSIAAGDQPVALHFENDGGKPYMPCKSMRRVMVNVWGSDANKYVGRSMTLYRDDKVVFGGMAVGGIRISHMSDIEKDVTLALTVTRANRKPFTVKPLRADNPQPTAVSSTQIMGAAREVAAKGGVAMKEYWKGLNAENRELLKPITKELQDIAAVADGIDSGGPTV
jgi:hypothetical protein